MYREDNHAMLDTPANDSTAAPTIGLTVIIPARNESAAITATVRAAITQIEAAGVTAEVMLVDHGSTDTTVALATDAGATVLPCAEGRSVADLRNRGAALARGDVLVFIDADVTLTPQWAEGLPMLLETLRSHPRTLTGSEVVCPPHGSWIERIWFSVTGKDRSHVNSGHLIIPRAFFMELGGFDADLTTAEDFDLSQRARAAGGRIDPQPAMVAHHHGYPSTLPDFWRREVWHGLGSARSLRELCASRVGLVTLAVAASLPLAVLGALVHPAVLALPVLALLGASALAAALRPRRAASHFPAIMALYAVYFSARVTAVAARLLGLTDIYWKAGKTTPPSAKGQ